MFELNSNCESRESMYRLLRELHKGSTHGSSQVELRLLYGSEPKHFLLCSEIINLPSVLTNT